MKKLFNVIFNHEIWKRCNHCKIEFDQRFYKTYCPNCNKEN